MERIIMQNGENSTECPCVTYTKVIDGRSFIVRVFLLTANAEKMQEKIERILHRDILNAIRQSAAYDDYSIAIQLGIPESRVRTLKIKKELQYHYSEYDWKKAFIEQIQYAKYDDKKALVKVAISDPNVKRDIEHYIDTLNLYSEYQLNSKLLQMRADHFIELCERVNKEYAEENNVSVDSPEEIRKKLKECQSSDWIDDRGKELAKKIAKEGLSACWKDIAVAGSKAVFKVALNAIPCAGVLADFIESFIASI